MIDRQSRILVVPATSARDAEQQAERVIASIIADDVECKDGEADMVEEGLIGWHISNRYYEADVHFRVASSSLVRRQTRKIAGPSTQVRRIQLRDAPAEEVDVEQDGDELNDQVRDVFAALQLQPTRQTALNHKKMKDSSSSADGIAERSELQGVQAIILLVDREASMSEHRRLLATLDVSAFDLAISLVVALPIPLGDDGLTDNLTTLAQNEEVEQMYAGEGWEYVDLAGAETQLHDLESDDEDSQNDLQSDGDEKDGIERVREALMMHTWPGLTRNTDRFRRAVDVTNDDAEQPSALTDLRREIHAIDRESFAQPTAKDEQLAKAFLAQIEALQANGFGQESLSDPGRSKADLDAALQRFLEEEDTLWPAQRGEEERDGMNVDDAAWTTEGAADLRKESCAFEDDFSDFVCATASTADQANELGSTAVEKKAWTDDAVEELEILGDEDDILLLRALREKAGSAGPTANVQLDFEATLQAVKAHAERVRAITDHEQRREEAARIALALLDL